MDFASLAAGRFFDGRSQLQGSLVRTIGDDGAGDALGLPFLAVVLDNIGQVILFVAVDDVGGGDVLSGAEAHVQRGVMLKAETGAAFELHGGQPQVEKDAMYGHEVMFDADDLQVVEVVIYQ